MEIPEIRLRALAPPPRLHWSILLALTVVTFGLFFYLWIVVQATWVKKVRGRSGALILAIVWAVSLIIDIGREFPPPVTLIGASPRVVQFVAVILFLNNIAYRILGIATIFKLRSELEGEPIYIPLSGIMTFFFGPVYFQYFLHDFDKQREQRNGLTIITE